MYKEGGCGFYLGTNEIRPVSGSGSNSNANAHDVVSIGTAGNRFKNGFFSGEVKATTFDGTVVRSSHVIQDGAPVVDSLQIIRAFMKLRDAVDDPDSSVEELRDKLKVAVVDIIDQFQDQIDNMDDIESPVVMPSPEEPVVMPSPDVDTTDLPE